MTSTRDPCGDEPQDVQRKDLIFPGELMYNDLHGESPVIPEVPCPPVTIPTYLLQGWDDMDLVASQLSFEEVLQRFDGLLRWQVWLAYCKGPYCEEDMKDLMQVARIATHDAYKKFDPVKHPDIKFSTYLTRVLWTYLYEFTSREYRRVKVVVIKDPEVMQMYVDTEVHDLFLLNDVRTLLDDDAKSVFDCMTSPPSCLLKEIAREYSAKITKTHVCRQTGLSPDKFKLAIVEIRQAIEHVTSGRVYCNR